MNEKILKTANIKYTTPRLFDGGLDVLKRTRPKDVANSISTGLLSAAGLSGYQNVAPEKYRMDISPTKAALAGLGGGALARNLGTRISRFAKNTRLNRQFQKMEQVMKGHNKAPENYVPDRGVAEARGFVEPPTPGETPPRIRPAQELYKAEILPDIFSYS